MPEDYATLLAKEEAFGRIEEHFNRDLDVSLSPRGPEMLYDLVTDLGLPAGSTALDVGCGNGRHTIELAMRFGLNILGIDPLRLHIKTAMQSASEADLVRGGRSDAVRFVMGTAEMLPVLDASVDLVWCRDVLELVDQLRVAYTEIRRVLKPRGRALIYQMFATDRLKPIEAAQSSAMGCVKVNLQPEYAEVEMRTAGLRIDDCVVIGAEWGEYSQETTGSAGRKLLHAGRLLRDPQRYLRKYGQSNYDIALADCLWHVYRLIGKLSYRVYLLSRAG